jgi:hypothetical protein
MDPNEPATHKQLLYLINLGLRGNLSRVTKLQAMAWIDYIERSRRSNLVGPPSMSQLAYLENLGVSTDNIETKQGASDLLDDSIPLPPEIADFLWDYGVPARQILSVETKAQGEQLLNGLTGKAEVRIPWRVRRLVQGRQLNEDGDAGDGVVYFNLARGCLIVAIVLFIIMFLWVF